MNAGAQPRRAWWRASHTLPLFVLLLAISSGCAHRQLHLIYDKQVSLPAGRFTGPVVLEVPRRPADSLRDYEIRTELVAACGPLLRLSYPDGEVRSVGDSNRRWQELQELRARAGDDEAGADTGTKADADTAADTGAAADTGTEAATGSAGEAGYAGPSATPPGHWHRVTTETWPGQLEFLGRREQRCAERKRYTRTYATAYDEDGRLTVWAEVPQELADAKLRVRIFEVIDVDRERRVRRQAEQRQRQRERPPKPVARPKPKPEKPKPRKPRPPVPAPKKEKPAPALAEGATWSPGQWVWSEGRGKWVWVGGRWLAPAHPPAARFEDTSHPPVAGCTWQVGHWVWMSGRGRWDWKPGHWNPPPPRTETPGQPPVPESSWIDGYWIATKDSFKWIPGRWGKPHPRAEKVPPPPYQGARWRAGAWLQIKGKWKWSPGFYEQSTKPPPPPRNESAGAPPQPGAVWLRGFWRWDAARSDYRWVAGHWEIPPGEGYVWVADPVDPQTGYATGGHWKLIIEVPVPAPVEVHP